MQTESTSTEKAVNSDAGVVEAVNHTADKKQNGLIPQKVEEPAGEASVSSEIEALNKRIAELESDRKRASEMEIELGREKFILAVTPSPAEREIFRRLLPRTISANALQDSVNTIRELIKEHQHWQQANLPQATAEPQSPKHKPRTDPVRRPLASPGTKR